MSVSVQSLVTATSGQEYPDLASRAWIAKNMWRTTDPRCVSINIGDRGQILRGPTRDAWVEVGFCHKDPKKRVQGWVPLKYVQVGKGIFGKPTYRVKFVTNLEYRIDPPSLKTLDNAFARTVKALMLALRDQQGELTWMRLDVLKLLNDNKHCDEFFNAFLQGVDDAGLHGILSKDDFTFQDLVEAGQTVTKSDHRHGIYLRLYWKWKGKTWDPCGYGGQTQAKLGFAGRNYTHDRGCNTDERDTCPHYKIAQFSEPEGRKMIHFCIFDKKSPTSWFYLAEQLEVTIFDLYHGALKKKTDVVEVQAKPFGAAGPETGETQVASVNTDAENVTGAYEAARVLRQLAGKVFAKTGWIGCFGRTSFGAWQGLNWASPLGELREIGRVPWTLTENSEMEVYTRQPLTVGMGGASSTVGVQIATRVRDGKHWLSMAWLADPQHGPKAGQFIWPFVEITKGGKAHPAQFVRLPEAGPYHDQSEARQLAVRMVWRNGERWHSRYVQASSVWASGAGYKNGTAKSSDPPFVRYATVLGLKNHLQRSPVDVSHLPKDIAQNHTQDWGLASVRKQRFDFLSQVYLLEEMPVGPRRKIAQQTSIANSTIRIKQMGLDPVGVPFPTKDQLEEWHLRGSRQRQVGFRRICDGCNIRGNQKLVGTGRDMGTCYRAGNTDQCMSCSQLNVPCSWSPDAKVAPGTAAFQYFKDPERLAQSIKDEGTDAGISSTEIP